MLDRVGRRTLKVAEPVRQGSKTLLVVTGHDEWQLLTTPHANTRNGGAYGRVELAALSNRDPSRIQVRDLVNNPVNLRMAGFQRPVFKRKDGSFQGSTDQVMLPLHLSQMSYGPNVFSQNSRL